VGGMSLHDWVLHGVLSVATVCVIFLRTEPE